MANKNGNPQKLVRVGEERVADTAVSVKLPLSMDKFVRSLPNRAEWLREAIAEKYQREITQDEKLA